MQQIPADNRFRNCFKAPKGHVFVSSDYSSQELNIIAFGSQDPVWLKALSLGEDLHSTCAVLVYGQKWIDATEPECLFVSHREKCNCKGHKVLRTNVKTVNFGLAFGMSAHKLSATIEVPLQDAEELIKEYFIKFPRVKAFLEILGRFGVQYGYSKTYAPFFRKRYYPDWFPGFEKIPDNKGLAGSIERASKNMPIQGSAADMTKLAMYMIRKEIRSKALPVKLVMTVHDQIDTVCVEEFSSEWKIRLKELMEVAANKVITNGLLKADTTISKVWEK